MMFTGSFIFRQISGGIAGFGISKSLRYGISRGVFSNEAGLGTLAVLHGPAEHTTPWEQGMWAMFEVFFDTVVLCTLTALVILCTSQGDIETFSLTGAALAAACFSARSGIVGKWFISVSMVLSWTAGCSVFKRKNRDFTFTYTLSHFVFTGSICRWLHPAGGNMDVIGSLERLDGIF